jgi:hypothetical protein
MPSLCKASTAGDPYRARRLLAKASRAAKQRIGTATAGLIADGETVGLDGGTTALETARALPPTHTRHRVTPERPPLSLYRGSAIFRCVKGGEAIT